MVHATNRRLWLIVALLLTTAAVLFLASHGALQLSNAQGTATRRRRSHVRGHKGEAAHASTQIANKKAPSLSTPSAEMKGKAGIVARSEVTHAPRISTGSKLDRGRTTSDHDKQRGKVPSPSVVSKKGEQGKHSSQAKWVAFDPSLVGDKWAWSDSLEGSHLAAWKRIRFFHEWLQGNGQDVPRTGTTTASSDQEVDRLAQSTAFSAEKTFGFHFATASGERCSTSVALCLLGFVFPSEVVRREPRRGKKLHFFRSANGSDARGPPAYGDQCCRALYQYIFARVDEDVSLPVPTSTWLGWATHASAETMLASGVPREVRDRMQNLVVGSTGVPHEPTYCAVLPRRYEQALKVRAAIDSVLSNLTSFRATWPTAGKDEDPTSRFIVSGGNEWTLQGQLDVLQEPTVASLQQVGDCRVTILMADDRLAGLYMLLVPPGSTVVVVTPRETSYGEYFPLERLAVMLGLEVLNHRPVEDSHSTRTAADRAMNSFSFPIREATTLAIEVDLLERYRRLYGGQTPTDVQLRIQAASRLPYIHGDRKDAGEGATSNEALLGYQARRRTLLRCAAPEDSTADLNMPNYVQALFSTRNKFDPDCVMFGPLFLDPSKPILSSDGPGGGLYVHASQEELGAEQAALSSLPQQHVKNGVPSKERNHLHVVEFGYRAENHAELKRVVEKRQHAMSPTCATSKDEADPLLFFHYPWVRDNVYHQHNDNLLPLALLHEMIEDRLQGALSSHEADSPLARRRRILVLLPTTRSLKPLPMFEQIASIFFDEVIWLKDIKHRFPSTRCFSDAIWGRPQRPFALSDFHASRFVELGVHHKFRQMLFTNLTGHSSLTEILAHRDALRVASGGPRVTIIVRKGKRELQNGWALVAAFVAYGTTVSICCDGLSYAQQVNLMASTDILVGVHGAGLLHILHLPPIRSLVVHVSSRRLNYHEQTIIERIAILCGVAYLNSRTVTQHTDAGARWEESFKLPPDEMYLLASQALLKYNSEA